MALVLVTGGIRSGKSRFAEQYLLDRGTPPWIYLPTGVPSDDEFKKRIESHRKTRDKRFETLERLPAIWVTDGFLSEFQKIPMTASILLDSLGLLVSSALEARPDKPAKEVATDIMGLLDVLGKRPGLVMIVSEEVGLGGVPLSSLGRRFADCLGECNQRTAAQSDEVYFLAAGCPILLKSKP
jgi:adenosylcobinamide kinase/adenosylcobinamide-phosphate guanylyltransferase